MGKTLAALSDRLLNVFAPKVEARASAPCMQSYFCRFCDYVGSEPRYQLCMVNGQCTDVTCWTCLVRNPDC